MPAQGFEAPRRVKSARLSLKHDGEHPAPIDLQDYGSIVTKFYSKCARTCSMWASTASRSSCLSPANPRESTS